MAKEGGGSADNVSSPGGSPVPVIVGVLVAVVVVIILISLLVAAVTCYKIKMLKKYNAEAHASSNGELILTITCFHHLILMNCSIYYIN